MANNYTRMKAILALIGVFCIQAEVSAQDNQGTPVDQVSQKAGISKTKPVTGRVLDDMNEPLIGVSVLVEGQKVGTVTDIDGNFSINAPEGSVLELSYVGYTPQKITVKKENHYNIKMLTNDNILNTVVVTALGIKREEKALSYNVQQISDKDITNNKDANFVNSLSGKVAGVNINSSSSGVGGSSKVVMRGNKSISQSSNALYVIDGVPIRNFVTEAGTEFSSRGSTEGIADINPEDIETMSVLTGAAAAALYGSDAANGAILITTKKGKSGRTAVTVSQSTEFLRPFVMPEFQNKYGTSGVDKSWGELNKSNVYRFSPKDDYLQTGVVASESFTLSTGTDKNQTFISGSAINSKGIIPNNKYERYNFTFRNTTSFLDDKMTLDLGLSYVKQEDRNMINQGTYGNPIVTSYLFPRGNDWNEVKMYETWDSSRNIYVQNWNDLTAQFNGQNPYWTSFRNLLENSKDRYMMNAGLTYKLLDWMNVMGRIRVDNADNDYTQKLYATSNKTITNSDNGYYGSTNTKDKQTYGDLILTINKRFGEDLSLSANAGLSFSNVKQDMRGLTGPIADNLPPNVFHAQQIDMKTSNTSAIDQTWEEKNKAMFASAELGYKSTYYLTLTGRNEWPSQLAGPFSNTKSFFYPSVGTSVLLSELITMPKQIEFAKIRGSFASVGSPYKRGIANPTYPWNQSTGGWAGALTNYPMQNLKPERTDSWEIGLSTRFLKGFSLDVSLYTADTRNQLVDANISPSSAYKTFYVQSGKVRNKGIEISLGYQKSWNDFKWSTTYTFSANKNEVKELIHGTNPVTGERLDITELEVGRIGLARFILKEGGSLGDLYSTSQLKTDQNGYIYVNAKGEIEKENASEPIKLGSVFPKSNMGWRNDFSWKNINLSFLVSARFGGIVNSQTQATMDLYGVSEASANARDNGGVVINGGDVISAQNWYSVVGGEMGMPQYYTYSATNVRLQELRVAYNFSKKQLWNIADVTVALVGRNLWMIYNKAPFDPEAVASTGNYYQGIDYFMVPNTRNLGFNVLFKF